MKLVTLGPEGTFSELAAREYDSGLDLELVGSLSEVIEAVDKERVGILPIENSLQGTVVRAVDLLRKMDVKIRGEILLQIDQCLIGSGDEVEVVISHPQALAQCRKFVSENFPEAEIRKTESTAGAVELASKKNHVAAIAPRHAAKKYGLEVLEEGIQDNDKNKTRFIVVGEEDREPSGNDKTSLVFYVENQPGSLYNCLGAFVENDVNLTKLESRPSREALGDYYFFIDFEGHRKDDDVREAISELNKRAKEVKLLGSYPKGN